MYSLFFLFIYIISSFLHLENLKSFLYYFAFVYIIIMILYINLKHLEYYLNDKKNVSNFPGHQIIYTNRIMVSIFAGITTFCFFLLPFTGLERLLSQIGNQFLALLRWLILLLLPKDSPEEEIIEETKTATEEQSSLFASEEQAPEWLVQLLQLFLNILLILAVLAFIAGIIYLIYQLFQRFYQPPHENEDQQEFIKEEHHFITRIRPQKDDSPPFGSPFIQTPISGKNIKKRFKKVPNPIPIFQLPILQPSWNIMQTWTKQMKPLLCIIFMKKPATPNKVVQRKMPHLSKNIRKT